MKFQQPPWGLAAAARESLLHGNEHRDAGKVSEKALNALMSKFFNSEATPHLIPGDRGFLLSIVTPILYEQFPWQESIFEELSRSHALLLDGLDQVDTSVISAASMTELLGGMSLGDAIGATFFLQVGANMNGGVFDPDWLNQPNFEEVLHLFPRSNIEAMAERLTATRDEFKQDFKAQSLGVKRLARYDYNPLVRTPFVKLDQGLPVAPAPRLILRTVTPGGLFYSGVSKYGKAFADDLGALFENYIGRNLRLIDGADVHPEIVYGARGDKKSIDWFVVMPGLVLLVECKMKRLALGSRAGDPQLFEDLQKSLEKARTQLTRTVQNLAARTPEFRHIPTDRPMLGLIVSAEPIYSGSAYLIDHDTSVIPGGRLPDVPVAAVSARVVEMLVTHGADTENVLLELITRHVGVAISLSEIRPHADHDNAILTRAWQSYPFSAGRDRLTCAGNLSVNNTSSLD
ncbi:hypothetical protein [Antrihabitans cavernicola]|uniref:NERD domain-containing protein n=1 Tax=Antrihabitans cavernicola TaxID=2495913 RepID=A0A5A7SB18_9NOCA|nr:hypothetical protein [Spelaeibacter cavernicola]KAA0021763.1 hypothetical protein FOY51_17955 [Spelaeibacter cavernicola]